MPLTCPFCNAVVEAPSVPPASGRLPCPRCGDYFAIGAATTPADDRLEQEVQRHRQARGPQARSSRSIAIVLLIGLGLGALGVIVGLSRSHAPSRPTPESEAAPEPARAVAPLEMPGLAYLPDGTDSVIAIQLQALLASLPSSDAQDVNGALARLGVPTGVLETIERIVGLKMDEIDELVLGLKLKEGEIASQPVLVVQTRVSYSIEDLAHRRKATLEHKGERTYYRTPETQSFDRVFWWAPNDHILVVALRTEHLDAVPDGGRVGLAHLSSRLVEHATSLLPADTTCWAVLDSEKWETMAGVVQLFAGKRGAWMDRFAGPVAALETIVLGIRPENGQVLTAWFDLKSERAAADLQRKIASDAGAGSVSVGGAGKRVMVRGEIGHFVK
jgi:hypothetical protein